MKNIANTIWKISTTLSGCLLRGFSYR